jgi:outer membrane protein assembly complex protein YaeT
MKATKRFDSPAQRLAGVLVGLLLCGAVGLAQSPAARVMVHDVVPDGLHAVPAQQVMANIKTRPGQEYNQATVDEDVRTLYKTGQFAQVTVYTQKVNEDRVVVHFRFTEFPGVVQDIIYHGAKHLSPDELNTTVEPTGLRKGKPLNPTINQMARQAILNRYIEMGRLFSSVDIVEGNKRDDTRVVFNISEGRVIKVGSIGFSGNTFVSAARLRTQIDTSAEFLHLLGGKLNLMMVDHDVAKLEEYYKAFGYHDVRVSRELEWESDQQHVRLVFHIQEGMRYRVGGVDVEGMKSCSRDELLHLIRIKPGEIYDGGKAGADKIILTNYFGYEGRQTTVREQDFYDPNRPGEVQVQYEITERPPTRVGEIIIIGNDVTRENVIRRQIHLFPGQILTYPDIQRSEADLARLSIFEVNPEQGIRPTVSVLDPDSDTEFKNILVQVQETRTGSLLFGVGVNSDAGLTGSIVLNERNFDITRWPTSVDDLLSGHAFRGAGQELRIEAVPGTQLQRYSISWREPFLFDSPYSLGISGYYYTRSFNEYDESRLGTRITVGRKLNQYWSVSAGVRVEDVGVHNVAWFAPEDFQSVVGQNFIVGPRVGVTYDSRDSYLRATKGMLIDASFEEVLGDFTFPAINIEANKYWTVYQRADGSGRHVLAAHSQVGWVGSDAPVFERFYAGGFRSMRGFEFRGVGPVIDGFEVGGDFMFLNSLEYQVPIRANDQLYLVAFVDSGTVERTVEIKDYRVAAGVGLRITVPMMGPVPIALDFGFPIVKASFDKEQIFSFWVGFFR